MTYVSSDWHGFPLEKIKALFDKAGFGANDFLFVLGDVIDRGEHGVELLKYIMYEPNIELILGNHEAMMLSCAFLFDKITADSVERFDSEKMRLLSTWQQNGAEPTIRALSKEPPETRADILDYLYDAPLYDTVTVGEKDFLLVHAGLGGYEADKPIGSYTLNALLWTRPPLTTEYSKDFITVFGHTPTYAYGEEYTGKIIKTDTFINVDTGAARGFSPCLLRLDDLKSFVL